MLKIWGKTLWRCQPLKNVYKVLAVKNYSSFAVKDILYETSDDAGTLLTRFAKHIAIERQKICEQVPSTVRYSDFFPISNVKYFMRELQKSDKDQLPAVITFAFTYRSNADPAKFAIILNELDNHAVNNVDNMNSDTILRTLYAFLFLIPNWMTRLDFYGQAMQRLYAEFNKQEGQSKELFVQLCFYMGLNKKQLKFNVSKLLNSLLDKHLEQYINEMSTLDLALVSNAAYKTSNIINSEGFNQRLLREVLDMSDISQGNDSILITFIKSMRLQRLLSNKVCEYIENISQDKKKMQQLQIKGQVHLFAYLAENLWDSKTCSQAIIESITEQLTLSRKSNTLYEHIIRGKDICTFLWSCAQLNCSLSSIQFRTIENSLLAKLNAREFNYFVDQLVESCLCLWILGYKSRELLQAAVELKSETPNNRNQPKVDSRLTVLLSAAQIEEPTWLPSIIKHFEAFNIKAKLPSHIADKQDIPYREIIGELLKMEEVQSADLTCPINGINIPSIHVTLSSSPESPVFLEFITPKQTLHFSNEPAAFLRLKLRLLQSAGHQFKLLSATDAVNPDNLKSFIKEFNGTDEQLNEPSESSIKA